MSLSEISDIDRECSTGGQCPRETGRAVGLKGRERKEFLMEERGVVLRGIARVLNAGGSALLDVYDAVTLLSTGTSSGEKGTLDARLKEYEKKVERLYCDIGREVALRVDMAETSAAVEAARSVVAEYQAEIEKIKGRLSEIAAAKKAQDAGAGKGARARQAADGQEPGAPEPQATREEAPDAGTGDGKETDGEAAAAPAQEFQRDAVESAATAGETSPDSEKEETATGGLETLLKSDLLKICREKGIEADRKMTKAEIIGLIAGRS
jgi:hypothetical protein